MKCFTFLMRRPQDKAAWPVVYADRDLAEKAFGRVSPVVEVEIPPVPKTCGTCKHLGEEYTPDAWDEDGHEIPVPSMHRCNLLVHLNGSGSYNNPHRVELLKVAKAGPIDGSGYHATFCVTSDFGCTEWAPRD